jgi:hypothetical protein
MIGASKRMEGIGNNSSSLAPMMRESCSVSPFGKRTAGSVYGGDLGLAFGVTFLGFLSAEMMVTGAFVGMGSDVQRF